jgi:hypothetical protein
VLFYGALLFRLASFAVVEIVDPGKLLDWFIQIAATFVAALLAVVGGVWLFRYQDRKTEEQLARKLSTRVAVELKRNLVLLESSPTFSDARTGAVVGGTAVGVELSTVALRDLIRSNVLEPDEAMWAMNLEGSINAHNREVALLLSTTPITRQSLHYWNSEVARRQEVLRHDFRVTVQNLQAQGIEVPEAKQDQGIKVPG